MSNPFDSLPEQSAVGDDRAEIRPRKDLIRQSFGTKIEKTQLLILDDLFLVPIYAKERAHLTEIIEDRHGCKSIIVTSQLPRAGLVRRYR